MVGGLIVLNRRNDMCLDTIKKIKIRGKNLYKVLRTAADGDSLFSPINGGGGVLKRKVWLKEKEHRGRSSYSDSINCYAGHYPKGWHCFTNKKVAKSYAHFSPTLKVFRVKFKDLKKTGTQRSYWCPTSDLHFYFNCAVVGQIMILEEVK